MGGSAPFTSFVIFHVAIVVTRLSHFIVLICQKSNLLKNKTKQKIPTPKPSHQLFEEPHPLVTWGTSSGLQLRGA